MKNLPDDELFDALENRLRNYSEEPDDEVWRKISLTLPVNHIPGWILLTNRVAAVITLAAGLFVFFTCVQEDSEISQLPPSRSLEKNLPSATGSAHDVIARTTESSMNRQVPDNDLSFKTDSAGFNFEELDQGAEKLFQAYRISHSGDSGVSYLAAQPEIVSSPIAQVRQDTVGVEQIVKRDTSNSPTKKDTRKKENKKRSRLTVYGAITPLLSFHRVSPLSNDDVVIEKFSSPSILSASRLGINAEVGIQGKVTRRLEYLAGITYYHQSQDITYERLTSDNVIIEEDADKSYMVRPGVLQESFAYDMQNIGIQTGLLYSLKVDGLIHKGGVVINYQKGFLKSPDAYVYNNASSDYLSYQLVYRLEYRLKSGMSFFIQPAYMHTLYSNESLNAPFSLKHSRAGIGAGIVYSF